MTYSVNFANYTIGEELKECRKNHAGTALEQVKEMKAFLQKLGIRTTLAEMGAPLEREAFAEVLKETVTGPDMEHIPYEVTEDMIYKALCEVEEL